VKWLEHSKRKDSKLTIAYVDLKNFKNINDTYGHEVGDKVLSIVAQRLKNSVRKSDVVSRIGGDEFLIIFPDSDKEQAKNVVERVINNFKKPIQVENMSFDVKANFGLAVYPDDAQTIDELISMVDKAMYKAKNKGKSYEFFSDVQI